MKFKESILTETWHQHRENIITLTQGKIMHRFTGANFLVFLIVGLEEAQLQYWEQKVWKRVILQTTFWGVLLLFIPLSKTGPTLLINQFEIKPWYFLFIFSTVCVANASLYHNDSCIQVMYGFNMAKILLHQRLIKSMHLYISHTRQKIHLTKY